MKCVHCQKDSNYKDRGSGNCPGCGKAFVFEPQRGDRFTDMGFQAAINRVSGTGTVKFSENNLFYEFKRMKKGVGLAVTAFGIFGTFSVACFAGEVPVFGAVFAAVGLGAAALLNAARRPNSDLQLDTVSSALARWRKLNGDPKGLITSRPRPNVPPAQLQAELDSYSFDRAVITDTAETAELLLANDFHFENNCAVLSVDGTPAHAFEPVRRMLRKNPRLEVFALHDCTIDGCGLAFRLKNDPQWFKDFGTVHDVALRPKQAQSKSLKPLCEPAFRTSGAQAGMTPEEVRWLGSWNLKLAAIRPEQLIKRLYRSMQSPNAPDEKDGGDGGVVAWSTDATASDGGADSFG